MAKKLPKESYRILPKSPLLNVKARLWINEAALDHPPYGLLLRYWASKNILFWINAFVWALDTRETTEGTVTPFITFGCQDEAILKVLRTIRPPAGGKQHDIVVEKSRDMGATWMFALVLLWFTLYSPDVVQFFVMSYKEDVVDGGYDSVMGKMKFALEHMPSYMFPNGDRKSIKLSHLEILNTTNGSSIKGCSTTENSGVSGRYTAMLLDEFSLVKDARQVRSRTTACSNCRLFNGTHRGPNTVFAEVVRSAKEYPLEDMVDSRGAIEKISLHWSAHPWKARGLYFDKLGKKRSPWYDDECKRLGNNKIEIARELDMDKDSSGEQVFDGEEIDRLITIYARAPLAEGFLSGQTFCSKPGGNLRLWIHPTQIKGRKFGIGADISAGTGATPSTMSIADLDNGEKVGEFIDAHINPTRFGRLLVETGHFFNDALLCWENAGIVGSLVKNEVLEARYSNIYLRKSGEDTFTPEMTLKPGWHPSNEAKASLMLSYREALSKGMYLNRSEPALRETMQFIWQAREGSNIIVHSSEVGSQDATAVKSLHGDLVIADMQSWLLIRDHGVVREKSETKGGEEKSLADNPPYGSIAWRDKMVHSQSDRWDAWEGW